MKHIIILFAAMLAITAAAQRTETVTAKYTYYAPPDMSPIQAVQRATQLAQVDAIANKFGTIVGSSSMSFINTASKSGNGEDYMSFNECDVRGEWLETIGEPKVETRQDGVDVAYTVTVKGRIRELVRNRIDIDMELLYNGTDKTRDRLRNNTYHAGDYMYLYFMSPVDGYLTVYLQDDEAGNRIVQCLLPYRSMSEGAYPIKANTPYVFFSPADAEPQYASGVARLAVGARTDRDVNQLYVIFSPHQFAKSHDLNATGPGTQAVDRNGNALELLPRQLPFDRFQKWLVKNRRNDIDMQVEKHIIVVEK